MAPENTPSELRVFRQEEKQEGQRMPVRIEGEAITGKGRVDEWAGAVSRAEPGNAPVKEGEGSQQVVF